MCIALNVYEITYPDFLGDGRDIKMIRSAETAGKAKYNEYLSYSDAYDDPYIEYLKMIRIRKVGQSQPRSGEALPADMPWLGERIEKTNRLIREIASRSHRTFYYSNEDRYAAFHWAGGRLWFTDHYSNMPMILVPGAEGKTDEQKQRFSSGGTMWGLVNDFRDYIFGDDDANHNNGYGGLYCPHWGYPEEDMQAIREIAMELGYLKPRETAKA